MTAAVDVKIGPVRGAEGVCWDDVVASLALAFMVVIPLVEMVGRTWSGAGVENAPVVVQHLGLILAMVGALAAERTGHLSALGRAGEGVDRPWLRTGLAGWAHGSTAVISGMLAWAAWQFVASEMETVRALAYGLPTGWVQASLPFGFAWLGWRFGRRCATSGFGKVLAGVGLPVAGAVGAHVLEGVVLPVWPAALGLVVALWAGAPIFAILGGLALSLFASEGLPWASVALSHYQITVNPSLPALPLFTLAGLVLANTGAAHRLGEVFLALFGGGVRGTVLAAAVLCSAFTATTGGSGVTILALGGLLLPLLRGAGYPEQRSIGLITSASALGVLLAPSVPLIMFAVIARVPIMDMFLAGALPALLMVASLLGVGGFWRPQTAWVQAPEAEARSTVESAPHRVWWRAAWTARWELLAPVIAIGSLGSGLATPTEGAALTAAYAIVTQAWAHRELGFERLVHALTMCARLIGGVMLILGMALALTNFLVDAGIPDRAIESVREVLPQKHAFLLALCVFLFASAALMEIFAALVVLVPLLLPLTQSYGIDPIHFGVIFLAAMEVGFLCPPAGMNLYFASAMFGKPIRYVGRAVLPAMGAIFLGTVCIALFPSLSTFLPAVFGLR